MTNRYYEYDLDSSWLDVNKNNNNNNNDGGRDHCGRSLTVGGPQLPAVLELVET